jgi:hypothetical protein
MAQLQRLLKKSLDAGRRPSAAKTGEENKPITARLKPRPFKKTTQQRVFLQPVKLRHQRWPLNGFSR